eukprot:TRINITY_DN8959_c1_g1_i2.p1 TRINITY_DN8959_c1_g1~~TRINITY_DN8959_c1_g1_i2.p1  ORF type:complete len:185 (+),score=22.54 TRINITY_DN8959_c1_g1_i2:2665-3219(+)
MLWGVSFGTVLCEVEESKYSSLLSMFSNVFICRGKVDLRIWKSSPFDVFFSKYFSMTMKRILEAKPACSLLWAGLALLRVTMFCWFVVAGKVSTTNNLKKRGIVSRVISNLCLLFGKDKKVIDHMFVHCELFCFLCSCFLVKFGVSCHLPRSLATCSMHGGSLFLVVVGRSCEDHSVCYFAVYL